jgi:radical SAM protein with 4Fe4S-binding SPASM domain
VFIKRRSSILYRDFKTFGYLTDNRNFGYKIKNASEGFVGDKIVSQSGTVFLSVLSQKPQELEDIVKQIYAFFPDVDFVVIKEDAMEFFGMLEREGFIVSGESEHECDKKDTKFSYRNIASEMVDDSLLDQVPVRSTQEFLEEYFEGRPQLTNLHIEITSRCNERCIHCYIPRDHRGADIEISMFHDILRQCREMNVLHLTLTGGEPMLHRNFIEFLRMCREYEFSVNVLSNLTHLTDEILAEMKSNYLLCVQVSLYSMNPEIHDEITKVKGSFQKTKSAILKLIENEVPLQISCPIMKNNKRCYQDVVDWAKKQKLQAGDDYVILAKYNHSIKNLSCRLSMKEVEEVIREKVHNDEKYIKKIEHESLRRTNASVEDNVCSVCHSSICVNERGNVYPCAGWQDYVVGNMKSMSLQEIWLHSEKVEYLRSLRKRDFPKCIQCTDAEFCTMCLVRNANEDPSGDPLVVNTYYCAIARLNKTIARDVR